MKVLLICVFLGLTTSGFAQKACRTPNGEDAQCITIRHCPILRNSFNDPSEEVQRFLRESNCGYPNGPWVCCGSIARYQPKVANPAPYKVEPTTSSNTNLRTHKNFNLLPSRTQCGRQVAGERVIGGNETALDEFPWMALLEYRQNGKVTGQFCGGMLISDRYVLTAAHCVTGLIVSALGNLYRVRLGEHDTTTAIDCRIKKEGSEEYEECSEPHQDIEVETTIPHPNYNVTGEEFNDIALVRLAQPVIIRDNAQPVCLPINNEESEPGKDLQIAGWGRTNTSLSSDVKVKAILPIVSLAECIKVYAARRRVAEQQFCAGGKKDIDSCQGDSGGPIMTTIPGVIPLRWYAEGIVSYGPTNCGFKGWPGVYTKISSYMQWILDNIKA